MTDEQLKALDSLFTAAIADEPGIRFEFDHNRALVGFWFEPATGRTYVCGSGPTFAEAYRAAVAQRDKKTAEAIIEAEIRAEVEARMREAA